MAATETRTDNSASKSNWTIPEDTRINLEGWGYDFYIVGSLSIKEMLERAESLDLRLGHVDRHIRELGVLDQVLPRVELAIPKDLGIVPISYSRGRSFADQSEDVGGYCSHITTLFPEVVAYFPPLPYLIALDILVFREHGVHIVSELTSSATEVGVGRVAQVMYSETAGFNGYMVTQMGIEGSTLTRAPHVLAPREFVRMVKEENLDSHYGNRLVK